VDASLETNLYHHHDERRRKCKDEFGRGPCKCRTMQMVHLVLIVINLVACRHSTAILTKVRATRAPDPSFVQPPIRQKLYANLLTLINAHESAIIHYNVQKSIVTKIFITPRTPMLPVSLLMARPLLPHFFCVVKAFGLLTVRFKGKVFIRLWIVLFVIAVGAANHHAVGPPGKLLDIRAVICKRN